MSEVITKDIIAPMAATTEPGRPPSRQSPTASLRFTLAGIMRLSERIVDRVVETYDRVFQLDRTDEADIYLSMGQSFIRSGKVDDAVAVLQRTLVLQPDNGPAWCQLGAMHLRQGDPGAALEAFLQARRLCAESFDLLFQMARALGELEQHEKEAEVLQRALELAPRAAEAHYRLGVALDHLGRYAEAAAAFEQAIEHDPRQVAYYQSLGFTLESLGRHGEAIVCFKRAVSMEQQLRA